MSSVLRLPDSHFSHSTKKLHVQGLQRSTVVSTAASKQESFWCSGVRGLSVRSLRSTTETKDKHIRDTNDHNSKLFQGVNVSVDGCLSLFGRAMNW